MDPKSDELHACEIKLAVGNSGGLSSLEFQSVISDSYKRRKGKSYTDVKSFSSPRGQTCAFLASRRQRNTNGFSAELFTKKILWLEDQGISTIPRVALSQVLFSVLIWSWTDRVFNLDDYCAFEERNYVFHQGNHPVGLPISRIIAAGKPECSHLHSSTSQNYFLHLAIAF